MADIGLDRHHEKDMRPRVVRYAEQQLRQGWELVIYHDRRDASWRRGAETLRASYGYATIVLEYFVEAFGDQIIEVYAPAAEESITQPSTPTPSPKEEEMTVKTKAETTDRRHEALVFDRESYTYSEISEMTGLPRHRLKRAQNAGTINTFLGPASATSGRTARYVKVDDEFVAWLTDTQHWQGPITLESETAETPAESTSDGMADGMPQADEIEISASGVPAGEVDDAVDQEVNRVRAAVERVKAHHARGQQPGVDVEYVTTVLEGGRVRVRDYVYACSALDHSIHVGETVLAMAPLSGPMPLEVVITSASGMYIGKASRFYGEEGSMLTIGGMPASEWHRESVHAKAARHENERETEAAGDGSADVPDAVPADAVFGAPAGWTPEEIRKAALTADRMANRAADEEARQGLEDLLEDLASRKISLSGSAELKRYSVKEVYRDERSTEQWLLEELADARGAYERALVLSDDDARANAWRKLEKAEADTQRYLRTLDESRRRIRKALRRPIGHLFTW